MKSTAGKTLPKRRRKGTGAEADTLARVLLAVRRISALLSLLRRAITYSFYIGVLVALLCGCLFSSVNNFLKEVKIK